MSLLSWVLGTTYQWMCCTLTEWQWMWYPNITAAGCEIKTDKNSSMDYCVMAVLLDFQPITDPIIITVLWPTIQSLLDEKGKRLRVWTCVFLAVRDKDGPQGFIHRVRWFWMNPGGNISSVTGNTCPPRKWHHKMGLFQTFHFADVPFKRLQDQ